MTDAPFRLIFKSRDGTEDIRDFTLRIEADRCLRARAGCDYSVEYYEYGVRQWRRYD